VQRNRDHHPAASSHQSDPASFGPLTIRATASFGWFVAGLVAYALLLIFATVAGKPGAA
jgi:hypothetical protein